MNNKGAAMIAGAIIAVGMAWLFVQDVKNTEIERLREECIGHILQIHDGNLGALPVQASDLVDLCEQVGGVENMRQAVQSNRSVDQSGGQERIDDQTVGPSNGQQHLAPEVPKTTLDRDVERMIERWGSDQPQRSDEDIYDGFSFED